jgi:hypothetical protein
MAHDTFISYSSQDKPTADAVCAGLESRGIRCWIAPRDILPGQAWSASIIDALGLSRLLVLIFSHHADSSPQVLREVERAVHKGVIVIPFRIEDHPPSKSMEYFLSTPHWLDALTPDTEGHIRRLAETIARLLDAPAAREPVADRRVPKEVVVEGGAFVEVAPDDWSRPPHRGLWQRFLSLFDDR